MRALLAPLRLVAARAVRRPGRWAAPALGIALAAAFACALAAEGTVAGDRGARAALARLAPLDRTVRVSWQGAVTPEVASRGRAVLRGVGLGAQTQVVLLNPVRLSGVIVRPAAIAPLDRWLARVTQPRLGPCRATDCPMLLAGGGPVPSTLRAIGVRIRVVGSAPVRSAAPLAFAPALGGGPPVLVTWDVAGLDALAGLSGIYRTHSWLAPLETARLHSWQLTALEDRLARSQADLEASNSGFTLSGPFVGLDAARAQARAAPRRLLLVGGGAIAAMALFVLLSGGQLRRDQSAELERLRNAGARAGQGGVFVVAESAWLSSVALTAGAGVGTATAAVLARASGAPVSGVLGHSLITPAGAVGLVTGLVATSALLTVMVMASSAWITDVLAIAAASALAVGLTLNTGADDPVALLIAPLCCLAAGVLSFRAAGWLLRGGERLARRAPVLVRLALVGLARSPALPSLAIAFVAVSVGLGGFALAYRSTLIRGAADEAADRVPLDAVVSPGSDFQTPLELAPPARWGALATGAALPVRRTEANYLSGGSTVTVRALGIPARALTLMHGWRGSDGSAPLSLLARRLRPPGPVHAPGPILPTGARSLSLRVSSPTLDVTVTADLRDPQGAVRRFALGTAGPQRSLLRARIPRGSWELEALELAEPTGLLVTNGHQNGENLAAATQKQVRMTLGPLLASASGARLTVALGRWRAVGAAAPLGAPAHANTAAITFHASGRPGVVRPAQPSDNVPVPVLADAQTAASSGAGGRLAMTVDGLPVLARVVGTLRRFPTFPSDTTRFVVADEGTLSSALDAQLPGQGRPDELWLSTTRLAPLRAALATEPLARLSSAFRADIEHELRASPISTGVVGALIAAAIVSAALAVLGLLTALLGGGRDERIERDLEAQGIGPRGMKVEIRARLGIASALGVCLGLAIAVLLTRLAVASVRADGAVAVPRPSLVTVVPWVQLGVSGLGAIAALLLIGWLATHAAIGRTHPRPRASAPLGGGGDIVSEGAQ